MLGNLVNILNQTLTMLAQVDFDRARLAADQLERPELRLAADLEMARSALGPKIMNLPMNGRQFIRME
jgi:hypothetical protein